MKYSDNDIRIIEAARESRYAYWNALLTLNGILITVFSALAFTGTANKWFIFVLVVSCIVSAWLLIQNFLATKELYKELGSLNLAAFDKLSEEDKKADIERTGKKHEAIERNEEIVQRLLFLEAVIILSLFFA